MGVSFLGSGSAVSSSGVPANPNAPEFGEEMQNITVPLGRDVVFECVVNNLGSYKVSLFLV